MFKYFQDMSGHNGEFGIIMIGQINPLEFSIVQPNWLKKRMSFCRCFFSSSAKNQSMPRFEEETQLTSLAFLPKKIEAKNF